jgi:ribosomal protein S18 acetylase RimI-like enzyme
MPALRRYVDSDWDAVLDIGLLAFAPAYESFGRLLGTRGSTHVRLDWRTCVGRYLRSLTRPRERRRLVVAEMQGSVVGFVHYEVDADEQSGTMGISAVHPALQGKGIGALMYNHVFDAMRAQGVKYATADTAADSSNAPARRAYEKVGFVPLPMVHYFKSLVTPAPASADQEGRTPGNKHSSARPTRSRNSSGSRSGRKRR